MAWDVPRGILPVVADNDSGSKNASSCSGCLLLLLLVFVVMAGVWGIGRWVLSWPPQEWSVMGDVARNVTGLLTFGGVLVTAIMIWRTNVQRAKEATSEEFRDQMHWAADTFSKHGGDTSIDDVQKYLAVAIAQKYADDPPKHLDRQDRRIAMAQLAMYNLLIDEGKSVSNLDEGPAGREDEVKDKGE